MTRHEAIRENLENAAHSGYQKHMAMKDALETNRRCFLENTATGVMGLALHQLITRETASAAGTAHQPGRPHFPAKAKRVLQIFCPGAASHMDLWEHKPMLDKMHGQPLPGEEELVSFQGKNGTLMKSPWPFVPAGQSGKRISSMLPCMARHVDDIAFFHGMHSKTNTHGPGCVFVNTGHPTEGFPSAGAWISYALGGMTDNLPAYVAIPDIRGEPPNGKANWSNGFLPAKHQAIVMAAHRPVRNLYPPGSVTPVREKSTRDLLGFLNRAHAEQRPRESELRARISSYELAAKMQLSAPEVRDFSSEPSHVHRLYGTDSNNPLKSAYAKNCILARRLLERGVRFVSLYCASRASGVDGLLNWDAHKTLKADYQRHLPVFDQSTAALLTDLKQRGLMDDTLILWGTEFGRMPTRQQGTAGRDHNPDGFTLWMSGAGVKGGVSYGATDSFGRRAEENPTTIWEFYSTVLHLLGLDFEQLSWYHNGLDRRLTDVHGHVVKEVLA